MISRSSIANAVTPGLNEVFYNSLKTVPKQHTEIFSISTSNKKTEYDLPLYGFGLAIKKDEGTNITYDDPGEGYKSTYTHDSWALGFKITEEAYDDELYGMMAQMASKLALSMAYTKEVNGASILNNGFNDSFPGADAEPLFGDATAYTHPLKDTGGTDKNRPSTNVDLSMSALKSALIDFRATLDDQGLVWQVGLQPKFLVVPPDLEDTANELIKSEKDPETMLNTINVMRKRLTVVVNDFITDTDAWYLLADKNTHKLKLLQRKPLRTESADDFDSGDMKYKAIERYIFGHSDWRGTYGCPGA